MFIGRDCSLARSVLISLPFIRFLDYVRSPPCNDSTSSHLQSHSFVTSDVEGEDVGCRGGAYY